MGTRLVTGGWDGIGFCGFACFGAVSVALVEMATEKSLTNRNWRMDKRRSERLPDFNLFFSLYSCKRDENKGDKSRLSLVFCVCRGQLRLRLCRFYYYRPRVRQNCFCGRITSAGTAHQPHTVHSAPIKF